MQKNDNLMEDMPVKGMPVGKNLEHGTSVVGHSLNIYKKYRLHSWHSLNRRHRTL